MLEVILLIAAVAVGITVVMRMDVTPRATSKPAATPEPAALAPPVRDEADATAGEAAPTAKPDSTSPVIADSSIAA